MLADISKHQEQADTGGKDSPKAMTLKAAQAYSGGLSRSLFYKLFATKQLTRLKAGKRVLIMKADLDAYLQSIRQED
jgi:excisionase family DNA binding protein